ncbi:MAG: peptidoglycan DD-metalloendopeptidase family protein [Lachnospiraceae bacterium]|nr:peptidoglycan DD-metalloendopeptidase family protein [Lachnospiraceae bacterium]
MVGVMIQAAFLVIAILAVQKLFGEKLHAYVRYGLWLIVVIRLMVPVNLIQSPISMLRIVDKVMTQYVQADEDTPYIYVTGKTENVSEIENAEQTANASRKENPEQTGKKERADLGWQADENIGINKKNITDTNERYVHNQEIGKLGATQAENKQDVYSVITDEISSEEQTDSNASIAHRLSVSFVNIIRSVWLTGSLLAGGFFGLSYLLFRRRLRKTRIAYQGDCEGVPQKRCVPVYLVKGLESPCLAGFFRPAVYIGTEVDTDSDTFRYAVIHEQVHYLHGDHLWAMLRMVLVSMYWLHPFVWIAAAASARDGEIACDYGATRKIGQEERFAYSEMLLTFSQIKRGKRVYSYGTMLRPAKSELKERILWLTEARHSRAWAGVLAVVCMILIAGCALTGASTENAEGQDRRESMDSAGDSANDSRTLADSAEDKTGNSGENGTGDLTKIKAGEVNDKSDDGISDELSRDENSAEKDNSDEPIREVGQIEAQAAELSGETIFGADGPRLDYAGGLGTGKENVIIFHDYFGLIVYDLMNRKVVRSLDLKPIGCHMTQGDDACQVAVSADGNTVWLHPGSKQYKYRYDVENNLLWQEPLVKTFDIDLEGEDLFNRYLVTEDTTQKYVGWRSNYLYEDYKDEWGLQRTYIYLYVPNAEEVKLGNLQCTWDDMVFMLEWNHSDESNASAAEDVGFPYRYDGIVNEVQIIFDKPCNYSRISDTYISRVHPYTQEVIWHEGIDYVAETGSDVYAAAAGIVYETGYLAKYGNYVVLLHINGEMTYYCHCQKILVEKDDQVERGSTIATVGSTGMSTGAHLHFAISSHGEFVDPQEEMRELQDLD